MRIGSSGGHGASCSYRRQAPLSVLWLALLAVATGPAACFVMPSSTRLRGAGFFAVASPPPKIVLRSWPKVSYSGVRGSSSADGDQRRVYALARGGNHVHEDEKEQEDGDRRKQQQVGADACARSSTAAGGGRNARGFRAVKELTAGKGLRAAASVLRASATGVDLQSALSQAGSRPKRILILMSDTGGGHRASSQALTAAIDDLYGDQVR